MCKICNLICSDTGRVRNQYVESVIDATELDCCQWLSAVPDFLTNLEIIRCVNSRISSVPSTLISLREIYCGSSSITTLPNSLKSLRILNAYQSRIFVLPEDMPLLENLILDFSPIRQLSKNMPNLKILSINNTGIISLPIMPMLEYFYCNNTNVSELPVGSNGLKKIECSNSKIKCVPDVLSKLESLKCKNTMINSVASKHLKTLYSNSRIKYVSDSIRDLHCKSCEVNYLPNLRWLISNNLVISKKLIFYGLNESCVNVVEICSQYKRFVVIARALGECPQDVSRYYFYIFRTSRRLKYQRMLN